MIHDVFGRVPRGIRASHGYYKGLEDEHQTIQVLSDAGIEYVSSDGRDKKWGINPPLVDDGSFRQPHFYDESTLLEIPIHGWQDTAFAGSRTGGVPQFNTWSRDRLYDYILAHYGAIILQAKEIALQSERPIWIGLSLHPLALREYDPHLTTLQRLLRFSLDNNVQLSSYEKALTYFKQ